VILDLFSRRVVGFAMNEQVTRELALEALGQALGSRPETREPSRGCIPGAKISGIPEGILPLGPSSLVERASEAPAGGIPA
jgi:hypothetical protein